LIGRALAAQGEHQQAHDAFQTAITHLSHTVDASHPALLEAQRQLAAVSP
jgi:hypothetical protein